jgi:NADPH:quinone reductase-like Zn-dependent oxidoreductase
MKAIVYSQYGSPDVLRLAEVPKPTPKDDEVLIKVHAAATNPADWHLMRAEPFFARFETGLFKPENPILGLDVAGVVEAVGSGVKHFKPGDAVFGGGSVNMSGGFAEYTTVRHDLVAMKPENVSFVEAASTLVVGFTAIQGLRDSGKIQAGQHVLINGASGGVGTFAVQYAKDCGAEVTGVCSTRNLDLVRSLGADHVIDYTKNDFADNQYDLIFDCVGNRSVADMARALNDDGKAVVAGFTTIPNLLAAVVFGKLAKKDIGLMGTAEAKHDDLMLIQQLLAEGRVKAVIDRTYPFEETAEAMRYLETGHARGKVMITME